MPADGTVGCLTKDQSQHLERLGSVRRYVASLQPGTIVVTGTAQGVDNEARHAAKACGLNVQVHYPRLGDIGASLAQKRSMVENSDRAVVYWSGSAGTGLFVDMYQRSGRELIVLP